MQQTITVPPQSEYIAIDTSEDYPITAEEYSSLASSESNSYRGFYLSQPKNAESNNYENVFDIEIEEKNQRMDMQNTALTIMLFWYLYTGLVPIFIELCAKRNIAHILYTMAELFSNNYRYAHLFIGNALLSWLFCMLIFYWLFERNNRQNAPTRKNARLYQTFQILSIVIAAIYITLAVSLLIYIWSNPQYKGVNVLYPSNITVIDAIWYIGSIVLLFGSTLVSYWYYFVGSRPIIMMFYTNLVVISTYIVVYIKLVMMEYFLGLTQSTKYVNNYSKLIYPFLYIAPLIILYLVHLRIYYKLWYTSKVANISFIVLLIAFLAALYFGFLFVTLDIPISIWLLGADA
ncbi:hypothetical protein NEFER03_1723 [Nematocida sp. LUAm3]|nr:hypothetical protein NEFER03_1723 [Nematocida sp. LUAm3]KAI5175713.1 hypothetical protein NEFER02_1600 [Nematocida sp. LUAm2]KAI5178619.1 hypothetical protein NEFER01_1755 [Nematocida sp. LUAm1]